VPERREAPRSRIALAVLAAILVILFVVLIFELAWGLDAGHAGN
jgi:hypothetical protein